ncbi:MAG: triose-phosphate isomerase [Rhodocyclaceae bacterium]|nr:triose-phosphate isomerase [Rhodocyclaceae bacterium]
MRRKLVAGNWKMHGNRASNAALLAALKAAPAQDVVEVAVCAPFPYLSQLQDALAGSPIAWGAQNLSQHAQGAYTGEVSAGMVAEFGCRYAIVGHSERRALYGDSDAIVAEKFIAAQKAGVTPIFCLGETLAEREAGITLQVVGRQIDAVLHSAGVGALARAVIAYEPVWAIGTGRTATSAQAQEVHAALRDQIAGHDKGIAAAVRILYGGSVKRDNAAELFSMADVDGGLIGGASLVAEDFLAIVAAAAS